MESDTPEIVVRLCVACGRKLKPFQFKDNDAVCAEITTADGNRPEFGAYGDNATCSLECIRIVYGRILQAVPGVIDLLPPDWRLDRLEKPNNDLLAAKLKRSALKVAKRAAANKQRRRTFWGA